MIAILGEALIDLIGGTGNDGQPCFYHYAGGCALNAATAAARLDSDVLYIGKLSSDMFGQQMQSYFENNRVQLLPEFCSVAENSMIGFAKIDATGAASYVFYSDGTTVTTLSADEIKHALASAPQIAYLHVGSVAIALDESGNQILKALTEIEQRPFIFFDPNVRPTVIKNFETYRERVLKIVELSSVVKLSHEDLEMLYPKKTIEEGVQAILDLGAQHVILTKGKDGLQWRSKDGIDVSVPAIDNPIVDSIGVCGLSFLKLL